MYRSIKTQDDPEALHQDLTNIQEWERKWLMSFNTEKCEVLRISSKRKNIIASIPYSIHGTALRTVDEAKYLGVTIHRTLKWKPHVNNICKRSNSTLGFLRRNLRKCPPRIKEQAYKTYVRPTLEYSSTVWDPHTIELTSQIEMVQRRAARFVTSDYGQQSSVTTMLQKLKWQTLSERRAHSKVIMLYRIMNGLVAIPAAQPYQYSSSGRTRGHHLQLRQQNCRISVYQHSYFPSVVCLWNVLPSYSGVGPIYRGLQEPPLFSHSSLSDRCCFFYLHISFISFKFFLFVRHCTSLARVPATAHLFYCTKYDNTLLEGCTTLEEEEEEQAGPFIVIIN